MPIPEGVLVEFEGMEWSPGHTSATEGDLSPDPPKWYDDLDYVFVQNNGLP